jgi:hypothetical protein
MTKRDEKLLNVLATNTAPELAIGFMRYEAVRKLTPGQFADLRHRAAQGGNFDAMVDKLVEAQ